MDQKHVVKTRR